ncbi:hypothetical protein HPB50_025981 [Hyalomma asiaticum]|uniref:Uncharacterized protein n=1 Tax=Hyalomma asiaticum TaxID=266040 RepID=A0ACB7T247_HYAAI|nr:hypothetical protein HPB50_025981 [Hyalomma asiaticum]
MRTHTTSTRNWDNVLSAISVKCTSTPVADVPPVTVPFKPATKSGCTRKDKKKRPPSIHTPGALGPRLRRLTFRSHALPVGVRVLLALGFNASGSFQATNGDTVGVSQSSVSRVVARVAETLLELAPEYIRFPATLTAANASAIRKVSEMSWGPLIVRTCKSSLLTTWSPSTGLYSLDVQAVCLSEGPITQLTSKWPGSTHDSFIRTNCALRRFFQCGELPDGWLLG